jgi:hypothetical protein
MDNNTTPNERKVTVGFKCSPPLRISLTQQAEKLGITLSYHIETCLLTLENKENLSKEVSDEINALKERIAFYEETALLQTLYKENRGKALSYTDERGKKIDLEIKSIQDVFTIIINSFKTTK